MVLTVDMSKLVSPRFAEPLFTLTPARHGGDGVVADEIGARAGDVDPVSVESRGRVCPVACDRACRDARGRAEHDVDAIRAVALIVLPAATLKLSIPMRAEPLLNTPIPIRRSG